MYMNVFTRMQRRACLHACTYTRTHVYTHAYVRRYVWMLLSIDPFWIYIFGTHAQMWFPGHSFPRPSWVRLVYGRILRVSSYNKQYQVYGPASGPFIFTVDVYDLGHTCRVAVVPSISDGYSRTRAHMKDPNISRLYRSAFQLNGQHDQLYTFLIHMIKSCDSGYSCTRKTGDI